MTERIAVRKSENVLIGGDASVRQESSEFGGESHLLRLRQRALKVEIEERER